MSDAYTCQAEDENAAAIAVLLLGNGKYGLKDEKGETVLPLMIFAGEDACNELINKHTSGAVLSDYITANEPAIAAILQSVMTVGFSERKAYDRAMELIDDPTKRDAFRAEYHDRNRTSMNDIGGRAWRMAAALQKKPVAA